MFAECWNENHDRNPIGRLIYTGYFLTKLFSDQIARTGQVGLFYPRLGSTSSYGEHLQRVGPLLAQESERYRQRLQPIRDYYIQPNRNEKTVLEQAILSLKRADPSCPLTRDEEILVETTTITIYSIMRWINTPEASETDPFNKELRERTNQQEALINTLWNLLGQMQTLFPRRGYAFDMQAYRVEPLTLEADNEVTTLPTMPPQAPETIPTRPTPTSNRIEEVETLAPTLALAERIPELAPKRRQAYQQYLQALRAIGEGATLDAYYEHCKNEGMELPKLRTWTRNINRAEEDLEIGRYQRPQTVPYRDDDQEACDNPEFETV